MVESDAMRVRVFGAQVANAVLNIVAKPYVVEKDQKLHARYLFKLKNGKELGLEIAFDEQNNKTVFYIYFKVDPLRIVKVYDPFTAADIVNLVLEAGE